MILNDNELADLFEKFASGNLNQEEEGQLKEWASESPINMEMLRLLSGESKYGEDIKRVLSYDEDAAWRSVKRHSLHNRLNSRRVFAMVASLMVVSTLAFAWVNGEKVRTRDVIAAIGPGTTKAVFTAYDGGKRILSSWYDDSVKAEISTDSLLMLGSGAEYITLSTPEGCEYEYVLPDGTKVWLNSQSSIKYPANFAQGERDVKMKGEVYFDVAKDASRPFIIDVAGQGKIKVLGTSFNVKAYDDESVVETTLVEGKIWIVGGAGDSATLSPGMHATISSSEQRMAVKEVDTAPKVSWKDGYFLYDNEVLSDICVEFSRWYKVDIKIDSKDLASERYSLRLLREMRFLEVLNALRMTREINVRVDGKGVIHLS